MLKLDSSKSNTSKKLFNNSESDGHKSRKPKTPAENGHAGSAKEAESNQNPISLLVKAAERVDRGDMSGHGHNSKTTEPNSSKSDSKQSLTNSIINEAIGSSLLLQQSSSAQTPLFIGKNGKPTRPFKAYPRDSLSMSIGGSSTSTSALSNLINSQSLLVNPSQHTINGSPSLSSLSNIINKPAGSNQLLLSTTVNTLASLLSQQQQQPVNNSTGTGVVQGPVIPPETIISLIQSLISTSAVAQATATSNQAASTSNLAANSSFLSNEQNSNGILGSLNDIVYSGIQGVGEDPLISLNNIYNPTDFCVQHRKRIQQAQERLLNKLTTPSSGPTSHSSLVLSKLSDLIPMTSQINTSLVNNGLAANTTSTSSRRRSNGSKRSPSASESESSPGVNLKAKCSTSSESSESNNGQAYGENRVETPDTTTSEIAQENIENNNPEKKSVSPIERDQNGLCQPNDEYLNYPPKKRHKIINTEPPVSNSIPTRDDVNLVNEESSKIIDLPVKNNNKSREENISTGETTPKTQSNNTTALTTRNSTTRSRNSSVEENSLTGDEAYRERRRKNNEAAKRSRDARRAKEDDIALRAALLERENLQLKVELAQLKQETNRLRCLLYNS